MQMQHIAQPTATAQHATGTTFVYVAAVFAALGGLLLGYDTGVISGAEIFIKNVFQLSAFAQGVIVSGVLIGAVVGALSGGRLADRYGRRRVLIVTSIIFGLGSIMSAVATSAGSLICGGIVLSVSIGPALSPGSLCISPV